MFGKSPYHKTVAEKTPILQVRLFRSGEYHYFVYRSFLFA